MFFPGTRCTIGRALTNDIVIDDFSVARVHAFVVALGDGTFDLIDNNTANGVFVCRPEGTVRIQSARVGPQDRVIIGRFETLVRDLVPQRQA